MLNKLKNNENKGFTLIEIVIVIVIIAILATVLVPSMISWIDSANEKKLISAGDTIRQSVNAQLVELYKDDVKVTGNQDNSAFDESFWNAIINSTDSNRVSKENISFTVTDNELETFSYTENGKTATYTKSSNQWTVE
ncbi:MAG: prepilin-type N-terminal cleavage/methylation domain-containing protein [Oscillospiraceae bacterium]|nr:prepilin-type N-terminal cleavage/methylation domain-containing protein [Oscillospiraceae bacterium]